VAEGRELIQLAIFGRPVAHSLSPVIHPRFAAQFGLDIDYQRVDTGVEGFPAALESFRNAGGTGCNITLPLKQEAWRLAAQATEEVGLAQAANTLVLQPDGGWLAHTTDGAGLMTDLVDNHHVVLHGRRILILGAGGATASILGRLLAGQPSEIMLVNRNLERANSLSQRFASLGKVTVSSWSDLPMQGVFDLVINATSLGHHGEAPPLAVSNIAPDGLCYDLNYFKASLPLKKYCEETGIPYIDGLGMLVGQAAESFAIWTGRRPETRTVIESLRRATG
jgi:shikimate dehydrogenase